MRGQVKDVIGCSGVWGGSGLRVQRHSMEADVLVLGGGPAGSTAATLARRKGLEVLLLERDTFPRPHVGESLLPASLPILELLGVLDRVESHGFVRKYGATMVWGSDRRPWTWWFRESNGPFSYSYQVVRSEFDHMLLEHSREQGVRVEYGHRAVEPVFEGDRAIGVHVARPDGSIEQARARFVIDATGQQALFARRLQLRNWDEFFRNLAVYSYFEGAEHLTGEHSGNIFIESFDHGWSWKIPLHNGESSVGLVVDAEYGAEALRSASAEDFLREQLRSLERTSGMLHDARMVAPPVVVKDWSYMAKRLVGPGYALAGDAACFVDPLFSSGVALALVSGMFASAHAVTTLKDPSMERASGEAYSSGFRRKYSYFRELAKFFYGSNRAAESHFWQARSLAHDDWSGTAREAFINTVSGYPPDGYERVVIERGDAPPAFLERLSAADARRHERREELRLLLGGGTDDHTTTDQRELFLDAVPRFAHGVGLQRILALNDGEFGWTDAFTSPGQPDGTPASPPVARLLSLIDGKRSIREIFRIMRAPIRREHHDKLLSGVTAKVGELYVDGIVESLVGMEPMRR